MIEAIKIENAKIHKLVFYLLSMKINHDFIWQEGKYIDFWSIPHVLIGSLLAWLFMFWNWNFYTNLLVSFSIILGWEFFELYALDVHEHFPNKVFDVITGVIGFYVMYWLILKYGLNNLKTCEIILAIIYSGLCGWGLWHNYHRGTLINELE